MRISRLLPIAVLALVLITSPVTPQESPTSGVFAIAAGEAAAASAQTEGSAVEAFEKAPGDTALRWTSAGRRPVAKLVLSHVPKDMTDYRILRLKLRAVAGGGQQVHVCFTSGEGKVLQGLAPAFGGEWTPVEMLLPEMPSPFGFDPAAAASLTLSVYAPEPFETEIDDVELVKAAGGWRYTVAEEAARLGEPRFTVADFESAPRIFRRGGIVETVPDDGAAGNTVLRWSQAASPGGGGIQLQGMPGDIRPYREVHLRARVVSGEPQLVSISVRSPKGGLNSVINGLTKDWREYVFYVPKLLPVDDFVPGDIRCLEFLGFDAQPFVLDIDDVALVKAGAGWKYSATERRELGIDTTAPRYRIAGFEERDSLSLSFAFGGAQEIIPLSKGPRNVTHALRWRPDPAAPKPILGIWNVPADLRDYRVLRFRMRAERPTDNRLLLNFNSSAGALGAYLPAPGPRWQDICLLLPEMKVIRQFDPEHVVNLEFISVGPKPFSLELDDIELGKDAGGWKRTDTVQIEEVFGAERARKVKTSESEHFRVWTDSAAAGKEFPKSLEKIFSFAAKELGLTEVRGKFAVYVFQNSDLYFDFCVRQGWSRAAAQATAGHAARSYFATFYQSPSSAIVAHEMTHAIVHRALGEGGGSWFAEGVATHIENLWQKKSSAEEFAGRLRSGDYVGLEEFFDIPRLAAESDPKGGPRSAVWLYMQAGAFFEFIVRGPFAKSAREIVAALAVLNVDRADCLKEIEKIFGLPVAEIEKAWLAWGRDPPKRKP